MCEDEDEDEMAAVMMTAPRMVQRTRKDSESGVWAKSVIGGRRLRRLMVKCLLRDRDHFLDDGHSDRRHSTLLSRSHSQGRNPLLVRRRLTFYYLWVGGIQLPFLPSFVLGPDPIVHVGMPSTSLLGSASAFGVASSVNRLSEERSGKARSHDI